MWISIKANPALSEKYAYTLDNGPLNDAQRQFYEENGFLVIRGLVSKENLKKYE